MEHKGCCAFCPAAATDGHEWLAVPHVTLDAFEAVDQSTNRR